MSSSKPFASSKKPGQTSPEPEQDHSEQRRKRRANLYDAVAGRVNSHGFIPPKPYASKYRDTASSSKRSLPPEEVLFRRKGMPIRYEETDRYFAHESLSPNCPLPSSELLESIHTYTADFYDQAVREGRANNYSMNGQSLLFMGILLEELAKESLGETGDLALVEGDNMPSEDESTRAGRRTRRKRANSGLSSIYASSGEDLDSVVKRMKPSKKRRLARRASTTDMDTG
ncbi:hypothetical protein BJX61DRAFT_192441 [Aspergillus egyptiacus]|nr:hypothetical protein BJX61DRAFT_192441 [Aspergillus egyptiacus]